jgi:hypothetical protein
MTSSRHDLISSLSMISAQTRSAFVVRETGFHFPDHALEPGVFS